MTKEFRVTYTAQITKEITFETEEEMQEWLDGERASCDLDLTLEEGKWSDGQTYYSEGR
tara:strand:- start:672 stop:848 length:177 start_codon:yes stop_codon:yes gene_type:complete